jgi:hypothetical protein
MGPKRMSMLQAAIIAETARYGGRAAVLPFRLPQYHRGNPQSLAERLRERLQLARKFYTQTWATLLLPANILAVRKKESSTLFEQYVKGTDH